MRFGQGYGLTEVAPPCKKMEQTLAQSMSIGYNQSMSNDLELKTVGADCLRQISEDFELSPDTQGELDALLERMEQIMFDEDGIGLAAPQVGVNKRILMIANRGSRRYPGSPAIPLTVFINPEITWVSRRTNDFEEGCLSVPDERIILTRPRDVKVRWTSPSGRKHHEKLTGLLARVFLHEFDHLEGRLILDYVE